MACVWDVDACAVTLVDDCSVLAWGREVEDEDAVAAAFCPPVAALVAFFSALAALSEAPLGLDALAAAGFLPAAFDPPELSFLGAPRFAGAGFFLGEDDVSSRLRMLSLA